MKVRILLNEEQINTKPKSCTVLNDYGKLTVRFENGDSAQGTHCLIEDSEENIQNWLGNYKNLLIGVGNLKFEQFKTMRIKKKLSFSFF